MFPHCCLKVKQQQKAKKRPVVQSSWLIVAAVWLQPDLETLLSKLQWEKSSLSEAESKDLDMQLAHALNTENIIHILWLISMILWVSYKLLQFFVHLLWQWGNGSTVAAGHRGKWGSQSIVVQANVFGSFHRSPFSISWLRVACCGYTATGMCVSKFTCVFKKENSSLVFKSGLHVT